MTRYCVLKRFTKSRDKASKNELVIKEVLAYGFYQACSVLTVPVFIATKKEGKLLFLGSELVSGTNSLYSLFGALVNDDKKGAGFFQNSMRMREFFSQGTSQGIPICRADIWRSIMAGSAIGDWDMFGWSYNNNLYKRIGSNIHLINFDCDEAFDKIKPNNKTFVQRFSEYEWGVCDKRAIDYNMHWQQLVDMLSGDERNSILRWFCVLDRCKERELSKLFSYDYWAILVEQSYFSKAQLQCALDKYKAVLFGNLKTLKDFFSQQLSLDKTADKKIEAELIANVGRIVRKTLPLEAFEDFTEFGQSQAHAKSTITFCYPKNGLVANQRRKKPSGLAHLYGHDFVSHQSSALHCSGNAPQRYIYFVINVIREMWPLSMEVKLYIGLLFLEKIIADIQSKVNQKEKKACEPYKPLFLAVSPKDIGRLKTPKKSSWLTHAKQRCISGYRNLATQDMPMFKIIRPLMKLNYFYNNLLEGVDISCEDWNNIEYLLIKTQTYSLIQKACECFITLLELKQPKFDTLKFRWLLFSVLGRIFMGRSLERYQKECSSVLGALLVYVLKCSSDVTLKEWRKDVEKILVWRKKLNLVSDHFFKTLLETCKKMIEQYPKEQRRVYGLYKIIHTLMRQHVHNFYSSKVILNELLEQFKNVSDNTVEKDVEYVNQYAKPPFSYLGNVASASSLVDDKGASTNAVLENKTETFRFSFNPFK